MRGTGGSRAVRLPLTDDFFDLHEVMRSVGDRSELRWVVRDAWFNGDVTPLWPEGVDQAEQESEKAGGAGLTWLQMSSLSESCRQVIDGRFTGYGDDGRPVLQLEAIDSSYWVVWAHDPEVLSSVRSAFPTAQDYDEPEPEPLAPSSGHVLTERAEAAFCMTASVRPFPRAPRLTNVPSVQTLFDGSMFTSYRQYYVVSDPAGQGIDDANACFAGQRNGLCGAATAGVLFLTTGTHTGAIPLQVELFEVEPAMGASWTDVVEVSFRPKSSEVTLLSWAGEHKAPLAMSVQDYRVRFCGQAFEQASEDDEEPPDRYLLQFWPAPDAPDAVLRCSGDAAQYWHTVRN